ncbi:MAG: hypothetical protein ACHP7K_10025 [Actinomycetales bacterium]|jgi:hypothetical protein
MSNTPRIFMPSGALPVTGFDRLALRSGLALVAWSRRHALRRLTVPAVGEPRLQAPAGRASRLFDPYSSSRLFDPYSPDAVRTYGAPPDAIR